MQIRVYVVPDARREKFEHSGDNTFDISIREEAEGNMANKRVVELIAEFYEVPQERVRILTGHRSRTKLLTLTG